MKTVQDIESWIHAIEISKQGNHIKEQEIKGIVDLWKFANSYNEEIEIAKKGELLLTSKSGKPENISVVCSDLFLNQRENIIPKILLEIETELLKQGSRYLGLYTIQFNNPPSNFDTEEIENLKTEIISCIKGEVILYKYIYKIQKLPSSELKIYNRDFRIVECKFNDIQRVIAKNFQPHEILKKQWLVLVLSTLDNGCKSFLIDNKIRLKSFQSDFDKVFIFDFYKSEVIELNVVAEVYKTINAFPDSVNDVA